MAAEVIARFRSPCSDSPQGRSPFAVEPTNESLSLDVPDHTHPRPYFDLTITVAL